QRIGRIRADIQHAGGGEAVGDRDAGRAHRAAVGDGQRSAARVADKEKAGIGPARARAGDGGRAGGSGEGADYAGRVGDLAAVFDDQGAFVAAQIADIDIFARVQRHGA